MKPYAYMADESFAIRVQKQNAQVTLNIKL